VTWVVNGFSKTKKKASEGLSLATDTQARLSYSIIMTKKSENSIMNQPNQPRCGKRRSKKSSLITKTKIPIFNPSRIGTKIMKGWCVVLL
jgi:hypothetical protein